MKNQNDIASKLTAAALGAGLLILALHPLQWLVTTWFSPDYDSSGWLVFLVVAALFAWSLTSPRQSLSPHRNSPENGLLAGPRLAWVLLAFTALVRLAGGLLAVNTIGALALALDILALGLLAGLAGRRRAVSPWWLAALFVLSLPVERVIQRTIGFGLQLLSAEGAGALLSLGWEVQVEGARLLLAGRDVLVDLPCSGARGLMLMLILLATLMAVVRPGFSRGWLLAGLALVSALAGNIVRISLLALGLAFPQAFGGLDVMAQPWHDLIGLFSLALAAAPLILVVRHGRRETDSKSKTPIIIPLFQTEIQGRRRRSPLALPAALTFLLLTLVIINLPARPMDVDRTSRSSPLTQPQWLDGYFLEPVPLSEREKAYFIRYGGAAVKGVYGPNGLLLVRTSSPLRHLHAPDECLRGLGFQVEYLGLDRSVVPTAVYKAEGPDGRAWRVGVTFSSSSGRLATSVTEAAWHWLRERGSWTAVQRLTPWAADAESIQSWDQAVWAALDLPASTQD
jgi:Transmembrane exosortase (Exosortase_EpsH).